jgi:hypothetical protein
VIAAAAVLAGCAGLPRDGPPPLAATEVAERFKELTGDTLVVRPFSEELEGIIPRVDYVDPPRTEDGKAASRALKAKYGEFTIAVYEASVPARHRAGRPDARGIRWEDLVNELSREPNYVGAFKIYEPNVVLRWYPESRRRETNDQWERLDRVLRAIVSGRAG